MTGTPDPNWSPPGAAPQPGGQGNRFFQKLGVYALGVAIGLAFLGWVQYRKSVALQSQQTQRAEQAQQAQPAEPAEQSEQARTPPTPATRP
jgi:hypothetical protein